MKTVALIPTAGSGERFGSAIPKPLVDMGGKPVIVHTLTAFEKAPSIDAIILIVPAEYQGQFTEVVRKNGFKKVLAVIEGGATRTQSVRNGLRAVPKEFDVVLVHDGVRPLIGVDLIERSVALAGEEKAVVVAVPVKPTLKVVDPRTHVVRETLDRTLVWEIQTPQIFNRKILEKAYADDSESTDDAHLVERTGVPVKILRGDYRNIKITTPEDLVIAEALLKDRERH